MAGELVLMGSYDGSLYALGAADGKVRWTFATENYVHGAPCVVDDVAHFAGCDEVFHAVRLADGKEAYRTSATAYTGASVCIADNVALVDGVRVAFSVGGVLGLVAVACAPFVRRLQPAGNH